MTGADVEPIPVDVSGIDSWPAVIFVAIIAVVVIVGLVVGRDILKRRQDATDAKIIAVGDSITNGQKNYVVRKDIEQVHGRLSGIDGRLDGMDSRMSGMARDIGRLADALLTAPTTQRSMTRIEASIAELRGDEP